MVDEELARRTIDFLNELCELDLEAMENLVEYRTDCNEKIREHPTVQVVGARGKPINYQVGFLGVLNGLCGVYEEGEKEGWGPIAAVFSGNNELLGFKHSGGKDEV